MGIFGWERQSDPALLILASLAAGTKHGYAIMDDVEQMTGVHLGPGTLYGALARLQERGLVEALPAEERRRPYRLTALGEAHLHEQLKSIEQFVATSLQRLAQQAGGL